MCCSSWGAKSQTRLSDCTELNALPRKESRERLGGWGGNKGLASSCFHDYYGNSVSSPRQQFLPIVVAEFSLTVSCTCRTSFIERSSETPASAKQHCSSEVWLQLLRPSSLALIS